MNDIFKYLFILAVILLAVISIIFLRYVKKQNRLMDEADRVIERIISGESDARIECLEEGRIYRLFHDINSLAAILGAHADNESKNKDFLKNTIQDISHQLKTPISALSIYNEVLQGDNLDEDTIHYFNGLSEQEISRLENLVQILLKITKLDAMSINMDIKPESLFDLALATVERFAYRAQSEGTILEIADDLGDCCVLCDRIWMSEAFDNLVKNALDHTKEGDRISIAWKENQTSVDVSFEDTGSGIDEEDIYYIFNRFYRSKKAQDTAGIGLGLPLVKSIVESNKGTVEVESTQGEGTTFHVFLQKCSK